MITEWKNTLIHQNQRYTNMLAYELKARLTHLTLTGQDDDGLEFTGTNDQWYAVKKEETNFELNRV